MKQRHIVQTVLAHYKSTHSYNEGDDVIAILESAKIATLAALEISNLVQLYNLTTPDQSNHIILSGVGVSQGSEYFVAEDGKIFGECFDHGFILGEDTVRDFEVCVTEDVYNIIKGEEEFKEITFTQDKSLLETENFIFYHLRGDIDYECPLVPWSPTGDFEDLFLSRLEHGADVAAIDAEINGKCLQQATVVMFGVKNSRENLKLFIHLYETALSIVHRNFKKYSASILEPTLIVFSNPEQAMLACLEARNEIKNYNQDKELSHQIHINGFGIHHGDLLFFPNAFHIGDPINTSSKLGEDLAENTEILITIETWEPLNKDSFGLYLETINALEIKDLVASNNQLKCISLPLK